jgi:hypothetical protein
LLLLPLTNCPFDIHTDHPTTDFIKQIQSNNHLHRSQNKPKPKFIITQFSFHFSSRKAHIFITNQSPTQKKGSNIYPKGLSFLQALCLPKTTLLIPLLIDTNKDTHETTTQRTVIIIPFLIFSEQEDSLVRPLLLPSHLPVSSF